MPMIARRVRRDLSYRARLFVGTAQAVAAIDEDERIAEREVRLSTGTWRTALLATSVREGQAVLQVEA